MHTCYRQPQQYKHRIRARDNYTCQLCGKPGYEVDHIIPFAISHSSEEDNLRVLCVKCNRATRRTGIDANPHKTLDEWYSYLDAELARL